MSRSLRPAPLGPSALLVPLSLLCGGAAFAQEDEPEIPLSAYYGFGELDILKVEDRSEYLRTGDLNGDGLTDLLLSDDSNSRLDLFIQREKPDGEAGAGGSDVNDLPDSARYDHVKLSVDWALYGLKIGDFTADGRADILYVGAPDRLILLTAPAGDEPGTSDWTATAELERSERRLPDLALDTGMLAIGDLTGDDRLDVIVIGERVTYLLPGTAAGKLGPAEEIRNTSEDLSLAQIADLDGDGLEDLCYTASVGDDRVFAARLQEPTGEGDEPNTLGPELRFDLKDPRSITLGEVYADEPGIEVLAVTGDTGRLTIRKVRRPEAAAAAADDDDESGARKLTQYGFGGRGDRDFAVGDLDGDGKVDVVVSDPGGARVILFRQSEAGGLDRGVAYPSLAGVSQIRIGDADGDGVGDLFVLSETEEVLGRSVWEDGRLTFPVPTNDVENAVAFTTVNVPGAKIDAVFVVTEEGRRDYRRGRAGSPDKTSKHDNSNDP
ncbi:MAG: VCBS repeat-containing protein, partial [Planctomycetota bacterium]